MTDLTIPRFGEVLAEHLGGVPEAAYPFLLSQLERTAADRYRDWAEAVPEHRRTLLACAASEDEIADRVEAMFPPSDAHRALVAEVLPQARAAYYAVFEGHDAFEQMTIQAAAERQGAEAWQRMKIAYPDQSEALDALSQIERRSAERLDEVLRVGA